MNNPGGKVNIDLSDKPDGIYLLMMKNRNEQHLQKIVIKK